MDLASAHWTLVLAGLACGAVHAQSSRLNGPLPRVNGSDVTSYAVSPDGAWVVFLADAHVDNVVELFVAPSDGSAPAVLGSEPLGPTGDVLSFSAGATRIAYIADQGANDVFRLYSMPYDGSSAPVAIDLLPSPEHALSGHWIAPDGETVLYWAWDRFFSGVLYRVPLDGSAAPVELARSGTGITSPFEPTGFDALVLSADGQMAIAEAKTYGEDSQPSKLIAVRVDGSQPALTISTPHFFSYVPSFATSANGSHVVWAEGDPTHNELHAARTDGTGHVLLSPLNPHNAYHIAPDASRVVYLENADLFSVMPDGTQRVQLDPPSTSATAVRLTPDRDRAVFVASGNLYSVQTSGGTPTLLAGPGAAGDFAISADSATVVAVVQQSGFRGLFAVPVAGGASPLLLNGPPAIERGVAASGQALLLTPTRAVYRQDRVGDEVFALWSARLDGSAPEQRLGPALGGEEDVVSFLVSSDGARAVLRADAQEDEVFGLFTQPLDGRAPSVRLDEASIAGPSLGDVLDYRADAAGFQVVYRADQDVDERIELYATRGDGTGPTRLQSGGPHLDVQPGYVQASSGGRVVYHARRTLPSPAWALYLAEPSLAPDPFELDAHAARFPEPLVLSPGATHVVYRKELATPGHHGLFTRRLDLLGGPQRLDVGAPLESTVLSDFRVDLDGTRVFFRSEGAPGASELFSVPLAGTAPPEPLDAPLADGGHVMAFDVTPDGTRVVFLADQGTDEVFELFAAPADGSRPPVRLHRRVSGARDVSSWSIAPDGRMVVFRADLEADEQHELFAVSIHGAFPPVRAAAGDPRTTPVRLTPLAANADVQQFAFSVDGLAVFFRAGTPAGASELFRVASDGSTLPDRVHAPQPVVRDVIDFALSPDGLVVVYLADHRLDERFELFRVPASGGTPVLIDALSGASDVSAFAIAPDSRYVVYRADHTDEVHELFAAALDGSAPVRRLNSPLATGGDVELDFRALSMGRALFRADLAADGVFELFLGHPDHGPRASDPP